MNNIEETSVYKFWEINNETINAILFVLIGLELLLIQFFPTYIIIGINTIIIVLITRYILVLLPAKFIKLKEQITHRTIIIMTWGGLRGEISIALALSHKQEMQKDLWFHSCLFNSCSRLNNWKII